jgi:2-polyprenyl-6-methoxyphenol hydroxylase-like FAD-dependent oxidoreductase
MAECDVLIAGAGPTGLVLALWLTRLGVKVRIVDKTEAPGTTSRALAVQARTLELYRQAGLTDEVIARGHRVPAVNLWVQGERVAHVAFQTIGEGLTPYPYLQIFPQDAHERLLIEHLAALGVAVERRTELMSFTGGEAVNAVLRGPDGRETPCEARFLAGCDGARSVVRHGIGAEFPGGAYRQLFYVADVEGEGPAFDGELHIDLDEADFLAVFPIAPHGRGRLIGTVRAARAAAGDALRFEDVSDRAIRNLKVRVTRVNWFSTYHVHHRVTDRFRGGRAFLLGDAAHIHSPAGGQGMNTGIGDAINLAWKLAAVLGGRAPDALLDSYEAERMSFARRLVVTTDRVFTFATAEGHIADLLRTRLAPLVAPVALKLDPVREFLFRTVSQITLNYRDSALSIGGAGQVRGGDRLPWVAGATVDNFDSLAEMAWQAHVYGAADEALGAWCARQGLPLRVFEWTRGHAEAGLARDALYLLRPDAYVALADAHPSVEALERYARERGLTLGGV